MWKIAVLLVLCLLPSVVYAQVGPSVTEVLPMPTPESISAPRGSDI